MVSWVGKSRDRFSGKSRGSHRGSLLGVSSQPSGYIGCARGCPRARAPWLAAQYSQSIQNVSSARVVSNFETRGEGLTRFVFARSLARSRERIDLTKPFLSLRDASLCKPASRACAGFVAQPNGDLRTRTLHAARPPRRRPWGPSSPRLALPPAHGRSSPVRRRRR